MTTPTAEDVDWEGRSQLDLASSLDPDRPASQTPGTDLASVRQAMRSTGYPMEMIHFVEGPVEETLPAQAPTQVALLRLDTDWYQSTRHELEHLYPRLTEAGVLIIDDYGYFQGSRKAVDEYLDGRLLLARIDRDARIAVKRSLS